MVPFPEDVLSGMSSKVPLLCINSFYWQWKENVQSMLKVLQSSKEAGNENCSITTIRYFFTYYYRSTENAEKLAMHLIWQSRIFSTPLILRLYVYIYADDSIAL